MSAMHDSTLSLQHEPVLSTAEILVDPMPYKLSLPVVIN
jgi:hypothetical protein